MGNFWVENLLEEEKKHLRDKSESRTGRRQ